jgi:four helix bundle protein
VPANIAEGAAKRGSREFRRFLDTSLGSIAELEYALFLARELEYLSHSEWERIEGKRAEAGRVLWGLYRAVSTKETRAV